MTDTIKVGAGGGGAGAVGVTPINRGSDNSGGIGLASTISGASVYYAGGGSGGNSDNPGSQGQGNIGAGGRGADSGGGSGSAGATGVVIVSYPTGGLVSASGGTVTYSGINTVHTFSTSGTLLVQASNHFFMNMVNK